MPKKIVYILTLSYFCCVPTLALSTKATKPFARQQFAEEMTKLKEGMPGAKALRIYYGTNGHLTFPTLGQVYIDDHDKVQYIFGGRTKFLSAGKVTPPDPNLFEENELRELLRLIDKAPALMGREYNPLPIIQIVNTLQPLGKEKALAAIDEYLRVASYFDSEAREGLFLVLRILFDVPEHPGYMPRIYAGASSPPPDYPKLIPRFPIVVKADIPLLLIYGYTFAGCPEPVEAHVDYFRKNGKLKDKPLLPTNDPLSILEQFEQSPQWLFGVTSEWPEPEHGKVLIIDQLLRLVDSVYRIEPDRYGSRFQRCAYDHSLWTKILTDFKALDVIWDPNKNIYTFKDGTYLPPVPVKHYRRQIWPLPSLGRASRLILERLDKKWVDVILERSDEKRKKFKPGKIRVYSVKNKAEPVAEFSVDRPMVKSNSYESRTVELPEGQKLQAELSRGNKSKFSPAYEP
jgi:hypothetical protein